MRASGAALVAVFLLTGCTPLVARMVARRVSNQQLSIESFHGHLVERHVLLDDPQADLVKDVWYQKLSKVRVEVIAPAALAGQLFVYDGETVSLWWPATRFGLRITGLPAPSEDDWKSLVREQTLSGLRQFRYSRIGDATVAGHEATRWVVEPRDAAPYRYGYDSWMDQERGIPLRLTVFESPGTPWYEMQYESVDYDVPLPARGFTLDYPADATVLDWNLTGKGVTLDEANKQLDLTLVAPRSLPDGYEVQRVILDHEAVPNATLVMGSGPHWLSLTEMRQSVDVVPATGKQVTVGDCTGYMNLLGSYTTLSWRRHGTSLMLLSNLTYPELVEIAASVE